MADIQEREEHGQKAQVDEAIDHLEAGDDTILRFPWPSLDTVVGGLPAGSVNFLCAASGSGKTSFLLSAMRRWHSDGLRIYYAGLESQPHILRTQWACRVLGLEPGYILSHDYRKQMGWQAVRDAVKTELRRQRDDRDMLRVRFAPYPFVDHAIMDTMLRDACEFGANVIVIDHIDHIDGGGKNLYQESRLTVDLMLKAAQANGLCLLVASQLNNAGIGHDRLRNYRPVTDEQVYMGGHKKFIATVQLGLFRPLLPAAPRELVQQVREGQEEVSKILEPNTCCVNIMKHRNKGTTLGQRVKLAFRRGEVQEILTVDNNRYEPREVES